MLTCPDFSQCKVVVIGDAMLDRYWHGDTSRISPEAPVPIVKIEREEERVGGAANVAVNVQALGASTTLIGAIGEDNSGTKLAQMLADKSVTCGFVKLPNYNTILKLRVLGRHQQLIRLDFENKYPITANVILEKIKSLTEPADIWILSDYAKGMIAQPHELIAHARSRGIKILVDPKNADLSVYRGATLLTPNMGEFEACVGHCENDAMLEEKGRKLLEKLELEALLVTRGAAGMTLLQKDAQTMHIPARAREVFDITGAGDTVIAVLAACLAAGSSYLEAAQLANIAAGIAVGRLGTATITRDEIVTALMASNQQSMHQGILSLNVLLGETQRRKSRSEKIVMTNGCFDFLHAGHITYLQQARALGDCLIVAVNDDNSVKRLKGNARPINPLAERMQVLAALGCVDYVVPFGEDTPENLISQILPHILVKGGDYRADQVAGGKQVVKNGGRVEILPFVDGCSTTGMLKRLALAEQQELEGVNA